MFGWSIEEAGGSLCGERGERGPASSSDAIGGSFQRQGCRIGGVQPMTNDGF